MLVVGIFLLVVFFFCFFVDLELNKYRFPILKVEKREVLSWGIVLGNWTLEAWDSNSKNFPRNVVQWKVTDNGQDLQHIKFIVCISLYVPFLLTDFATKIIVLFSDMSFTPSHMRMVCVCKKWQVRAA